MNKAIQIIYIIFEKIKIIKNWNLTINFEVWREVPLGGTLAQLGALKLDAWSQLQHTTDQSNLYLQKQSNLSQKMWSSRK